MTELALGSGAVAHKDVWTTPLATLALCVVAVLALFLRDVADMARMWWSISTYEHCLLIIPIALWLVVQRRSEVAVFKPQGWWPGLIFVFAAASLWTLGEAGGIGLFRHGGIVLMIQSLVLTLLGPGVTRAVLFPLFYLVFLIPAGEEMVPALQSITAKLTIALMGISSIPHQVNGVFITIPNGYFEVAEECSGVKFLIAMMAYGALVCNVCFRSWTRRAVFMLVCVIVPILANGVRAFGTIWVAWMFDRDFAKGFDHIVYGWFFFGIVIALVMAMGWRFFDRKVGDDWLSNLQPTVVARPARSITVSAAALAAIALPVAWQSAVASSGRVAMPDEIALPAVKGWERVAFNHLYPWQPHFRSADHMLYGAYRNKDGQTVDLAIVVYAWQAEGREVVGWGQGAIDPASHWAWAEQTAKPRTGKAERITAPGPVNREVVSVYVIDGKATGSANEVKLATLKQRILGGDQAAVAILVSAEERAGQPARAAVDRFLADMQAPEQIAVNVIKTARGR